MNDSDDRIKEHYQSHALPDNVVSSMVSQAQTLRPKFSVWQRFSQARGAAWIGSAVAATVLVLVASFVHNVGVHAERTDRAIKEVAMNHSMRLDLEIKESSIDTIGERMVLLPFNLALPKSVSGQYNVKGARYCSLSGQIAAHIELTHKSTDRTLSVFMTRAADELNAIDNSQKVVDGVDVKIWRESGLVYAMVGSYEPGDASQ